MEVPRKRGIIREGLAGELSFIGGEMSVGEESVVPVLRALKESIPSEGFSILDAPPGTACPAVEVMRGVDRVILVTEPTPFGLHDLKLAVEAVKILNIPMGLVINRANMGDDRVQDYAAQENIPILMEIPYDRKIAESYSRGELFALCMPEWQGRFRDMYDQIASRAASPAGKWESAR